MKANFALLQLAKKLRNWLPRKPHMQNGEGLNSWVHFLSMQITTDILFIFNLRKVAFALLLKINT